MLGGATINRNSPQAAGLVGAWSPNVFPGGGTLYDRAGVNDAIITGGLWVANPSMGMALDYTGANYVLASSLNLGTNDFSIVAWFVPDAGSLLDYHSIVAQGQTAATEWSFYFSTNALRFYADAGGISARGGSFVAGSLYCGAVTRIGALVTVYLNSRSVATDATASSDMSTAKPMSIAATESGTARFFDGRIGEIRVYNRGLSAAEIGAIYADPLGLWQPTLQIPMDDDYAVGQPTLRRHGALPDSMIYHRNAYTRWG